MLGLLYSTDGRCSLLLGGFGSSVSRYRGNGQWIVEVVPCESKGRGRQPALHHTRAWEKHHRQFNQTRMNRELKMMNKWVMRGSRVRGVYCPCTFWRVAQRRS